MRLLPLHTMRLPVGAALAAIAVLLCAFRVFPPGNTDVVGAAFLIVQALCLPLAVQYPRVAAAIYTVSFPASVVLGYSPGIMFFGALFLIVTLNSIGHHRFSATVACITAVFGFYSADEQRFIVDSTALLIFIFLAISAFSTGWWIWRVRKQRIDDNIKADLRRKEITSLLHDTVAADLTSLIVKLEKLAITTPERSDELTRAAQTARSAVTNTRALLGELNAPESERGATASVPLSTTINGMIETLEAHGFEVDSHVRLNPAVNSSLINLALERTLKEATTNIVKYATPASVVTLRADANREEIDILISNAHRRQRSSVGSSKLGLQTMHSNLEAVSGTLTIENDSQNWHLKLNVPL